EFAQFRKKVDELYGDRVPHRALRRLPDVGVEEQYGVFMSQEVQRHAEIVLTHSRHAVELLRLDCSPGLDSPPIEVVPLGLTEPAIRAERTSAEGPLIVSFGAVAMVKGLDTML